MSDTELIMDDGQEALDLLACDLRKAGCKTMPARGVRFRFADVS